MKIRSGFVSNSSSSSFILLIDVVAYKREYDKQSGAMQQFLDDCFIKDTVFGKEVYRANGWDDCGESWLDEIDFGSELNEEDDIDYESDEKYQIFEDFVRNFTDLERKRFQTDN